MYNVLHLSDRCWLTIGGGVINSRPERIYPFSMFHLLTQNIKEDALPPGTIDLLMTYIRQGKYCFDLTTTTVTAGLRCIVM